MYSGLYRTLYKLNPNITTFTLDATPAEVLNILHQFLNYGKSQINLKYLEHFHSTLNYLQINSNWCVSSGGENTTNISGGGKNTTTNISGGGENTTTNISGGGNFELDDVGENTTNISGGGENTTTNISGGRENTTTNISGGGNFELDDVGENTTNISGGGNAKLYDGGENTTTNISGGGENTTTNISGGGNFELDDVGENTTNISGGGNAKLYDGGENTTTNISGGGENTTTNISGGGNFELDDVGENTTNISGGGENTTTNISGGRENTTNISGGGGENTTNISDGDENTTNTSDVGYFDLDDGGENTTNISSGGGENTTNIINISDGDKNTTNTSDVGYFELDDGGENTTNTFKFDDVGENTTNISGGGNFELDDVGENTTNISGGGENTTTNISGGRENTTNISGGALAVDEVSSTGPPPKRRYCGLEDVERFPQSHDFTKQMNNAVNYCIFSRRKTEECALQFNVPETELRTNVHERRKDLQNDDKSITSVAFNDTELNMELEYEKMPTKRQIIDDAIKEYIDSKYNKNNVNISIRSIAEKYKIPTKNLWYNLINREEYLELREKEDYDRWQQCIKDLEKAKKKLETLEVRAKNIQTRASIPILNIEGVNNAIREYIDSKYYNKLKVTILHTAKKHKVGRKKLKYHLLRNEEYRQLKTKEDVDRCQQRINTLEKTIKKLKPRCIKKINTTNKTTTTQGEDLDTTTIQPQIVQILQIDEIVSVDDLVLTNQLL
ncbi:uncharacterized protein [Musca autumnalis]|uniref:uncharacterized protein n=1 Tax=Musca autumnalis TaxID=221902 RepID=UPI003CEB4793